MSADNWTICQKCGEDFREDYELGIDVEDQSFYVSYHGKCKNCDFRFDFKHEEALPS